MDGKHFEEFEAGDRFVSQWRYIAESDLRRFITLAGIEEPLFESEQFLRSETDHHTWIVPGYLTLSFALGLFTRSGWFEGTGLAMLGAERLEFTDPVYVGDEIRTIVEVVETKPTSSDRGGILTLQWRIEKQDGTAVSELTSTHFIKKRG